LVKFAGQVCEQIQNLIISGEKDEMLGVCKYICKFIIEKYIHIQFQFRNKFFDTSDSVYWQKKTVNFLIFLQTKHLSNKGDLINLCTHQGRFF